MAPPFAVVRRRSRQRLLRGTRGPGGEPLALLALGLEPLQDPLDVVGQFLGGDLQATDLAAETGLQTQRATQVHLVALDLLAPVVEDQLALETDVRHLDTGAGVRAAVEVD